MSNHKVIQRLSLNWSKKYKLWNWSSSNCTPSLNIM